MLHGDAVASSLPASEERDCSHAHSAPLMLPVMLLILMVMPSTAPVRATCGTPAVGRAAAQTDSFTQSKGALIVADVVTAARSAATR